MRILPLLLLCLVGSQWSFSQNGRGAIDQAGFKQVGERGAVQFTWRFEGLVQIPTPYFRGFLYCQEGGAAPVVVVGGEENPAFASSQDAKRSAPKGSERILFELPPGATLHDYRVEMWLNGNLVAERHSPRFTAAAFTAKGLDATWWEPKVGVVDAQLQQDIESGIESGVAYLKKQQAADGSWIGDDGEHTAGFTALAAMALIKTGTKVDAPEIQKALRAIKAAKPHTTYEIGCALMLLQLVDPVAHRGWMEDLTAVLVQRQAQGTWNYEEGNGDLSNTQYGVLGLWAATRAGIEVDTQVWRDLAKALLNYTNPNDSFNYRRQIRQNPAHKGTLEMSAAGVGTAMIAQRFLQGDQKTEALRPKLAEAGRSGFDAMGRLFDEDPSGYSLYGIERVGALIGKDLLGRRDWYIEGAKVFVERQEQDGSVDEEIGGTVAGTSFALLFWKRSTRTTMEPDYDPDAYLREQMAAAAIGLGEAAEDAAEPAVPAVPLDPIEAAFAERFPMAEVGQDITLKSSAGKAVSGKVVRLDPTAVVLEVNGRSGTIPFTRLDKASRARCDAAFRAQAIDAMRKRK